MLKKIVSKTKKTFVKVKETLKAVVFGFVVSIGAMPLPVYAAGNAYLNPLTNLKTIMISIVAAAGVIVLIYGGVKFAISFQKMDQNGEHQAVYTIIAGGVMIGISAIVTALTA